MWVHWELGNAGMGMLETRIKNRGWGRAGTQLGGLGWSWEYRDEMGQAGESE